MPRPESYDAWWNWDRNVVGSLRTEIPESLRLPDDAIFMNQGLLSPSFSKYPAPGFLRGESWYPRGSLGPKEWLKPWPSPPPLGLNPWPQTWQISLKEAPLKAQGKYNHVFILPRRLHAVSCLTLSLPDDQVTTPRNQRSVWPLSWLRT